MAPAERAVRAARAGRTARLVRFASFALVGVAACAAIGFWLRPAGSSAAPAETVATGPASNAAGAASAVASAAVPPPVALPGALAGSHAPRLPLGPSGRLAKTRAVRDFFDYCLTAQSELTPAALDALVRREIAAQLDGSPAQKEALDVWQRYHAYFAGLAQLPGDGAVLGDKLDPAAMQLALDQRAALADRTLRDWAEPFFGDEQRRQRHDLERIRIANDPTLNAEQKAVRLAALDAQLTPAERTQQAALHAQQDAVAKIADLQKSGATPEQMRAQITQTLGPEAAARAAQMQQDDDAWQARYRAYAAERDRIAEQGLTPQDREAQIEQLRQQTFKAPGEALRAASLDRGGGE